MTSLFADFSTALFSAILHSSWQGCLLALVYALLAKRLHTTQSRYLLGMTLLTLAMFLFLGSFFYAFVQSPAMHATSINFGPNSPPLAFFFAIAWCIGATFVGGRYLCAWLWLRLVIVRSSAPVTPALQDLFHRSRRALNIPTNVRLRISTRIQSPMVLGVLKPVVLIPVSMATGVAHNVLNAVFIHELMHLRRYDHLALIVQILGETLLFFHPAIRWLSAEVRREREYRCDDDSIRQLGNKYDYARALVTLETLRGERLSPALMMNGGDLMERVQRLLVGEPNVRNARFSFGGFVAMLTIVLVMYSVNAVGGTEDSAAPEQSTHQSLSIRWLPPSVTQWQPLIEKAANAHGVSADLLALMLLKESGGDASVTSSAGAIGLMQVMPKTGTAIAEQRGINDFDGEQLFDPETNIDFGAWYLARQLEQFSGHDDDLNALAVSAYNAGPGAVRAYIVEGKSLPDETVGYRDMLMSLLSEGDDEQSDTLEFYISAIRQQLLSDLQPVNAPVSSPFGIKDELRGMHTGVDFAATHGDAILLPIAGTVSKVGEDKKRGKYVTVRHAEGIESHYYHLNDVIVSPGAKLEKGETLGEVGNTGVSTGPHLHFEIREFGKPVSPLLYGVDAGEAK